MSELFKRIFGVDILQMLGKLFPIVITVLAILIAIKVIMKFVKRAIDKSKLEKGLHSFAEKTIRFILYFIAVLIVADMFGIPISSLLATFSIVGLAASLAIQDTLSNIASGINIIITHPFRVGNYIDVGGTNGTVTEINFTYTVLRTPDNKMIHIPNKQVVAATVMNFSELPKRRVDLTFSLSYKADSEKVKEIMRKAIDNNEMVLKNEDIFIRTTGYGASGIDYTLRVWVESQNYWTVYFDLLEGVKKDFDKAGLEIPYDQLDVHLIND